MRKSYKLITRTALLVGGLVLTLTGVRAQVTLTATGGVPAGTFATISQAFDSINNGVHTGVIDISIDASIIEPATPSALMASGQGSTSYNSVFIHPSAVVSVTGATNAGYAVINFDGADSVTIDGSITPGGTTRDLTIQNTSAITQTNVAAIRLIGRTTLGLGTDMVTIKNCVIIGNTPGNDGNSGSTVTTSFGIYAGSTSATGMSNTAGSADYDHLTIENNEVKSAYVGIHVYGTSANSADTLMIVNNTIGSSTDLERIGFKGISCSFITESMISGNTVFNIKSSNSANLAGIEVNGAGSINNMISQNEIYEVHSLNTGGYGSYGININAGNNATIVNNVIHGILGTNYNSTSTTWHPFGIRLAAGTGHSVLYNSVNLFGDHTLGGGTTTYSAGLVVTGTGVTGLTVRNNIFGNKHTSAIATGAGFLGIWFPASYDFVNATIDNNAYMVTNDAVHHVGRVGATNYSTLNDWKAISQVNNPTNDVASQPIAGNSNAPYTSDVDLTIPATTLTPIESGGFEIAGLGIPNTDFTGANRPAGTGTAPDMGAYEFEGDASGDFAAPTLSTIVATPAGSQCTSVDHSIEVTAMDNVGVEFVTLNYSYDGVAQAPVSMTLNTGTAVNGTWVGIIPAAATPNVDVAYSIVAIDSSANSSSTINGVGYTDEYLVVVASPDVTINTGSTTTVSAATNDPSQQVVVISEIVQFKTGTGQGTYPAHIPTADNDFVELTNISDVPVDLTGFEVQIQGGFNGTYTIPSGVILAPSGVLVLAFNGTASDPANFYYGMNMGGTTSSGVANGYTLRNQNDVLLDAVATDGYVFTVASGVTASDWSGTIAPSGGLAGVRRTGSDSNTAADWSVASVGTPLDISVFNTGLNTVTAPPAGYSWAPSGATTASVLVGPYATAGTYTHFVTYDDGTCSTTDSVNVFVVTPVTPVADFVGSPLSVATYQTVTLTDLSTNVPDTWNWVISPATFNYVNGTSATSQNPEVEFTQAGLYDVTLTASNPAGSDDEIKLGYITVDLIYCTPGATNTFDTDIGNVTFAGINNGTATPVMSNPAANGTFTDFTAVTPGTVQQGGSYPFSVSQITSGATFYSAYVNVFVDLDHDGVFDPVTERLFSNGITSQANPTISGMITIPATASLGLTRMRVSLNESGTSTDDPCLLFAYGETEDYMLDIGLLTNCSGTPSAANTVAADSSVCTGSPVNLSLDVIYQDQGITYQWQSSTDGVTYNDVVGETNPTYSTTQSDSMFYQAIVTCTNSGLTITSTPVLVQMNPFFDCYCPIAVNSTFDTDIGNVTFGLLNNGVATPTLNNPMANGTYSDFTAIAPEDYALGQSYPFEMTQYTSGGSFYPAHLNVFIDYNQDGLFDPVTERVLSDGPTSQVAPTISGSITIPTGIPSGLTRMRVILDEAGDVNSGSCDDFFYGEVEDYLINIGCPVLIAPTAPSMSVCNGDSITLTASDANGGALAWYDADVAGNELTTGTTYGTPALTTTTSYWVEETVNGCPSPRTEVVVTVNTVNVGVTVSGIQLTSNSLNGQFQWIDCDNGNAPITGATGLQYTPTVNGTYAVIVTEGSCVDTSACIVVNAVGIDGLAVDGQSFSVYPNPSTGMVNWTVANTTSTNLEISLTDVQGKVVYVENANNVQSNYSNSVDFSGLAKGIYYVKFKAGEAVQVQKLVIE